MPSRCISHRRIADGPSPVNSEVLQAGMARCSTISTGRSAASPIPISLLTTGSRTMTRPVKSSRPGTLPCVRVISGAWELTPALAVVAAVVVRREALFPLRALLQVPARLPLEALLLLPVLLQVPVRLPLEAEVLAVEVPLLHRSFSAATVERLTSVGIPRYAPVPRSRRKPNSRP